MATDLFHSCGHCWVFQICWHTGCSTFTVSSYRIWNSSAGISSPPLALFIVKFSKAQLTSHSRMSGFRWETTPSWLSGSLRPFLFSSSVYPYHLFLISSTSVQSLPFLSFIVSKKWQPTPVFLPGKSPWVEEPGRVQTMGSLRVGHDWATFQFHALEKEMATHSSVLAWRIPGTEEPGGLLSMGSHSVGHNWSDLATAAARILKPILT